MSEAEAASPNGAPQTSVHDRIKAVLTGPSEAPAASDPPGGNSVAPVARSETPSPQGDDEKVVPKAEAEDQPVKSKDESDDAQSEEWQPTTLDELAEGLGWESDKLFGLPASIKIDGKEGKATLRDLIKSYQLDGHLHQKLGALDTDRKTHLAEVQKFNTERAEKFNQMEAGIQILETFLKGEYASVDWQKLATEDPGTFRTYQDQMALRDMKLREVANQINAERQQREAKQQEGYAAWLTEQKSLLQAKVPEWSDDTRRAKDKADMLSYLDSVGITKDEFEAISDHRHALVIRDAWKWNALQKGKPLAMHKVKAAPKLMKPGTQQSKAANDLTATNMDRSRLKQTGKLSDATPLLRRILFN